MADTVSAEASASVNTGFYSGLSTIRSVREAISAVFFRNEALSPEHLVLPGEIAGSQEYSYYHHGVSVRVSESGIVRVESSVLTRPEQESIALEVRSAIDTAANEAVGRFVAKVVVSDGGSVLGEGRDSMGYFVDLEVPT